MHGSCLITSSDVCLSRDRLPSRKRHKQGAVSVTEVQQVSPYEAEREITDEMSDGSDDPQMVIASRLGQCGR